MSSRTTAPSTIKPVKAETGRLLCALLMLISIGAMGATVGTQVSSPGTPRQYDLIPEEVKALWAPAPIKQDKPVPTVQKNTIPPHVGTWVMTWKGTKYINTQFHTNGMYSCGMSLKGAWKLEQNGRQLRVHEYNDSTFYNWSIDLREDGISGILLDDSNDKVFKLEPYQPADHLMPKFMTRAD